LRELVSFPCDVYDEIYCQPALCGRTRARRRFR
jgi:hypothetical protein